jgi:hypothetical protein
VDHRGGLTVPARDNRAGRHPGPEQPHFFTVEEASRTLPLVRRIVRDIVEGYPQFQRERESYRDIALEPGPELQRRLETLSEAIDDYGDRLRSLLQELDQVGCVVKDFQEGLVDFHSLYHGRPIFLCWKLDEERVQHWHELDAGFAGRRPITPEFAEDVRRSLPADARHSRR